MGVRCHALAGPDQNMPIRPRPADSQLNTTKAVLQSEDLTTQWSKKTESQHEPIFAPPTPVNLTGRGRGVLCSPPRLWGGGGDGDSELLTTTPAQRVVHTAKVFTAHKCRSKLIHSGNTEKKALTDCLMC